MKEMLVVPRQASAKNSEPGSACRPDRVIRAGSSGWHSCHFEAYRLKARNPDLAARIQEIVSTRLSGCSSKKTQRK